MTIKHLIQQDTHAPHSPSRPRPFQRMCPDVAVGGASYLYVYSVSGTKCNKVTVKNIIIIKIIKVVIISIWHVARVLLPKL